MINEFRKVVRRAIIQELGNTTDTYPLRNVERGVFPRVGEIDTRWEFQTENHTYTVTIFNEYPEMLSVDFTTEETSTRMTNEGNPFKVTATVIEAARRTWGLVEEYPEEFDFIRGFTFKPVTKGGGSPDGGKTNQRGKLYKTFIERQFPDAKIERNPHGEYLVYVR